MIKQEAKHSQEYFQKVIRCLEKELSKANAFIAQEKFLSLNISSNDILKDFNQFFKEYAKRYKENVTSQSTQVGTIHFTNSPQTMLGVVYDPFAVTDEEEFSKSLERQLRVAASGVHCRVMNSLGISTWERQLWQDQPPLSVRAAHKAVKSPITTKAKAEKNSGCNAKKANKNQQRCSIVFINKNQTLP
jgi:hypothetical protein